MRRVGSATAVRCCSIASRGSLGPHRRRVVEGGEITIHYDPMLAKVIAYAETRDAAMAVSRLPFAAIRSSASARTFRFSSRFSSMGSFVAGDIDTGFLDRETGARFRRR